tara:strand:+ start:80 stop:481 length:402 start_codon:yes stop_codon:yes gene_type:complete
MHQIFPMSEKIKYEIEFPIRSSLRILYNQISTASGLSEWFADNVNLSGKIYTFFWDGDQQNSELLSKKNNQWIKFRWVDEPSYTYFELKIVVDEITQDISLMITDFADDQDDEEESKLLWDKQIEKLRQSIGS